MMSRTTINMRRMQKQPQDSSNYKSWWEGEERRGEGGGEEERRGEERRKDWRRGKRRKKASAKRQIKHRLWDGPRDPRRTSTPRERMRFGMSALGTEESKEHGAVDERILARTSGRLLNRLFAIHFT